MPDESIDDKVEKDSGSSSDSIAYNVPVELGGISSGLGLGHLAYSYLPSIIPAIGYASGAAIATGLAGLIGGYVIGKTIVGELMSGFKPKKKEPEKPKPKGPPGMPMMG